MTNYRRFNYEEYSDKLGKPVNILIPDTAASLQQRLADVDVELADTEIRPNFVGNWGMTGLGIGVMYRDMKTALIVALTVAYSGTNVGVDWIARPEFDVSRDGAVAYWPGVRTLAGGPAPAIPSWRSSPPIGYSVFEDLFPRFGR